MSRSFSWLSAALFQAFRPVPDKETEQRFLRAMEAREKASKELTVATGDAVKNMEMVLRRATGAD